MNNLPHNELLSAYLDGELNAAERADVERLLAADPAARRLLDELRALSGTIQSLPRESLGEDLGPQVLRLAERRRAGEIAPDAIETAPVPLSRSVFRRFLSRRTLTWAGLTVAVAVMISVYERQNVGLRPAAQPGRELARAMNESKSPQTPPAIHAAPGYEVSAQEAVKLRGEEVEKEGLSAAAPAEAPELGFNLALDATSSADRSDQAATLMPAAASDRSLAPQVSTLGKPMPAARSPKAYGSPPASAKEKAAPQQATQPQPAAPQQAALVIRCDISREAARQRAFDKLLEANGIFEEALPEEIAFGEKPQKGEDAFGRVQQPSQQAMRRMVRSDREDFVYVEAAPEQIGATLDGLKAKPDLFLSVSVQPADDAASQSLVRRYAAAGQKQGGKAELALDRRSRVQLQRQWGLSPPQQQVLFVVRVAGNGRPSAGEASSGPSSGGSKPKSP